MADAWRAPFDLGRIVWPENTTVENIVIEYANLTAQRSGLWTVPEPGDLFRISSVPRGTVVLLARGDSNRGPLAGVVTTEINVDEIEDLELRLATARQLSKAASSTRQTCRAASRATQFVLRQRLLPGVAALSVSGERCRWRRPLSARHALGSFDFEVPGLRVVRVTQHGREIANARIRVGSDESITGLEVTVGK